jgi:hypothetical protein
MNNEKVLEEFDREFDYIFESIGLYPDLQKKAVKSFISQKLTEQKEEIIKWADENMVDGDLTYERLLMFIKKL